MTDPSASYDRLAETLRESGRAPEELEAGLRMLLVECPTWGFGDSGTRFATFQQVGRPNDVHERLADAAEVRRLTGSARAVALHFPWDTSDDLVGLRAYIEELGLEVGAVNPNLFQDPDYRLGSVTNADARIRAKAIDHLLECVAIARELGSTAQSLWLADGTSYAGQDDFAMRRHRLVESLRQLYEALPPEQELLIEYKPFEPAFYATDIADWGAALLLCQQLGERARVLVDLGHHLQGANVEQIVSALIGQRRLGGFHFNNRKYADDDLVVGSTNPLELFLVFCELVSAPGPLPRLTIDQSHNIEPKIEAMVLSVMNIQEAYVKALLVDRVALAESQEAGDVLAGHRIVFDAFSTDVRPLCAKVRAEMGAAEDPVGELRDTAYVDRAAERRGTSDAITAGWGL